MLKKFLTILGVKTLANYVRNWMTYPIINFFKSGKYNRTIYQESFDMAVKETYETLKNEITNSMIFIDKYDLRAYCVKILREHLSDYKQRKNNILCLEFGVWRGRSINYFSDELPEMKFIGFDSFQGIPEDWAGTGSPAGSFSAEGQIPTVNDNVKLQVGMIEETLPKFFKENLDVNIAFVHIDVDIYSTSKFILSNIKNRLMPGSIILFDDFCCFPGWKNGEYKALNEVFKREEYDYLGFGEMVSGITIK